MNTKIGLLRRVPLFQGLSKRQLEAVASLVDEVDVPAESELTHEGANGKEFVVLVDGLADVTRDGRLVNTLGPGDFLGEISLVTGLPRTATVTTRTPSRLLVLSASSFRSLLRRVPSIELKVLYTAAMRMNTR
jgi:CRP/FNR family transcriptional regulator, cyclic AMP receptor protein